MDDEPVDKTKTRRAAEADRIRHVYDELSEAHPGDVLTQYSRPAFMAVFERDRRLLEELARRGLSLADLECLDVGCGTGGQLARFVAYGADPKRLHGIDLREPWVECAVARLPACDLRQGDASELPYDSASMDLITQGTVLSSILDEQVRRWVADEMVRVCRPGGLIASYDFVWNPTNRHTHGITGGDLKSLFPTCHVETQRVTLAPPIARRTTPRSRRLGAALGAVVPLRSHLLAFITPDGPRP